MARLLFTNARLVTPAGELTPGWLATEGGRIAALGPGAEPAPGELAGGEAGTPDGEVPQRVDCTGLSLYPGFIDVHAHGAVGTDVMDADTDGLRRVARFYASHGVTAWTPTTWTRPQADLLRAVEAVGSVTGPVAGGATILGAHLEGPWVNPRRAGAQDAAAIRVADRAEVDTLLGTGVVRLVTLAPEVEGNAWLVGEGARRGVTVSIGHSDATYEEARLAVADGARHVTHTFNAMRPLGHREPGLVGAALTLDELRCELIADNVHVNPVAIDLLVRAKRTRARRAGTDRGLEDRGLEDRSLADGRPSGGHPADGLAAGSRPSGGGPSGGGRPPEGVDHSRSTVDPSGIPYDPTGNPYEPGSAYESGPYESGSSPYEGGEGGIVLVTDAVRVTGLPEDGTFDLGGRAGVISGGVARLPDGTIAGSVLTMDRAVANLHAATGLPPVELARAASLAPAAAAGVAHTKGALAVGKDADLVLLDPDFRVVATVVAGTVVYGRDATDAGQTVIIPTKGGSQG